MIDRIIVPLDSSETAERSLPYATHLAQKLGAEVRLVSIVEVPVEFSSWVASPPVSTAYEIDYWIESRQEYLDRTAAQLEGVTTTSIVSLGTPATVVVEEAGEDGTSIIVMSSHGRTGFRRLVLGSVAARIVRMAKCPTVVVPAHDEEPIAPPGTSKLVVADDGSNFSRRALDIAVDALEFKGSLRLVRVIEAPALAAPNISMGGASMVDYNIIVDYIETARNNAERELEEIATHLKSNGIDADWEIRDGDIADGIRAAAREFGADMTVLASHGRGGFRRFFIGSVAESLLAETHRPLFLIGPEMAAAGD